MREPEASTDSPLAGNAAAAAPLPEVLVVSYRRPDLLRRCLDSVMRHLAGARVHVWDNASDDSADIAALAEEFPRVDWRFSDDNVGFAAAVNALMRGVQGPTALLLNPDAQLLSDLSGCRNVLEQDHTVAAAAPNVEEAGHRLWDNAHREPTWVRHLVSYAGADERLHRFAPVSMTYRDRPLDVDGYLTGAALLVSTGAWRAVGEFDERYFLYGEEADWCHRARRRGLRLVSVDEPGVRHEAAGTVSDQRAGVTRSQLLLRESRLRYVEDQEGRLAAGALGAGMKVLERLQRSKRDSGAAVREAHRRERERRRADAPAFVVTTPTLGVGGAERQRVALANGLVAAGETVQLRALQALGPLAAGVDRAVDVARVPFTDVDACAGERTLLVTGTSRIEVAHGAAWRARNYPRGRWVVAHHNPADEDGPVFAAPVAALIRRADGAIYLSESHRRDHRRHQRLDSGRWWVVPNGIDVEGFGPPASRSVTGPVRLVTASRLTPVKQVDLLIRALGEGLDDLNWTLDVWGEGPSRPDLEAGLALRSPRITLRGWCTDVPAMLAQADVLCVPSRAEAQPMSILEAMAAGVTVVANPVAAIPEMLDHGAGRLVVPPDEEGWRVALREVIADPSLRRSLAAAGYQRVKRRYSQEAMVDGYRAVRDDLFGPASS